jgi:hypothetical protein
VVVDVNADSESSQSEAGMSKPSWSLGRPCRLFGPCALPGPKEAEENVGPK